MHFERPRILGLIVGCVISVLLLGCGAPENDGERGVAKTDTVGSADSERLADIPFYFSVPKKAVALPLNRSQYPYPTLWNPSVEMEATGLRVIAIKERNTSLDARQDARRDMAARLAEAGVLQDGDVALTFRPELAGTMAYPHIQMGSTHAGLVYTVNGAAFNIDSPLDGNYVGQFDTDHYAGSETGSGTTALHILRPRVMTDTRRAQLREWVAVLKQNLAGINGERAQLKFQSDYLTPIFVATGMTTRQTVTKLGQIIVEADTTTKLPTYCAEFAWHMIALSNCTQQDIESAPEEGAACVDPPFEPMSLVSTGQDAGLAEGPLLSLLEAPAEARLGLVAPIFEAGNPTKLSSGHRAVAEQVAPLMGGLSQYYQARASGAPAEMTSAAAAALNANVTTNYSPTAFLVNAMTDTRSVDYVATVVFVNSTGYEKAQSLARNPAP
jgi:hypothetical protein